MTVSHPFCIYIYYYLKICAYIIAPLKPLVKNYFHASIKYINKAAYLRFFTHKSDGITALISIILRKAYSSYCIIIFRFSC